VLQQLLDYAITHFLPLSLSLITLSMGFGLVVDNFKNLLATPRAAVVGLIGQLLLLPLLGFSIAWLLELPTPLAIGLILLTACPGGTPSNLFVNLAKGDTALSISLTAISGVVCIVTIPLYVFLASSMFAGVGEDVELNSADVLSQLLMVIIVPLCIGMWVRHYRPILAKRLEPITKTIAILLLLVIVFSAIKNSWSHLMNLIADAGAAVIILNLSSMTLGALMARAVQLPRPQIIAITMEVGVQNTTLSFAIAMLLLDNIAIAAPGIVYGLFVYIPVILLILYCRKAASVPALGNANSAHS
jgi:BASS family bile acid:Na+ symporter